ncbi:hypothetical protein [Streptomyces sp. CoH17]|uniref:hypothetical protein n=1 Tax=Streptomyces sp. CoH17 TaxID=2992806 RepID=UPI0022715E88|nr:hypothetical protein [Streptomyces sp. CoH17]
MSGYGISIFDRLIEQQLLTPYLERAMVADKWPEEYTVTVDSRPYSGTADGYFHPSSHCLSSPRWLYYVIHPDTKDKMVYPKRTLQSAMTLAMGSALHAVVQTQFEMSGLIRREDIEIPLVDEKRGWRGHADWRIKHPNGKRYGVEMKTMNSRSFRNLIAPKEFWVYQLNCYLDALDLDEGIILVAEAGYPYEFKEFHISRDDELLSKLYAKWDYVRECIARNTPPESFCCSYGSSDMNTCRARFECHLKGTSG